MTRVTFAWDVLLPLMLFGHVLVDIVIRPRTPVVAPPDPRRATAAFRHALLYLAALCLAVLPVCRDPRVGLVLPAVALVHGLLAWGMATLHAARPRPLLWWLLDQVLHLALLMGAASVLMGVRRQAFFAHPIEPGLLAAVGALFLFAVEGGSVLVASLLAGLRSSKPDGGTRPVSGDVIIGAGAWIGRLERVLILLAVWQGQWGAVGLVLTAKSIARFKELENREFSEIYLIGTMSSVLVAIACGLALSWLL